MEGANFPKIFPERVPPLGKIDIDDLRVEPGREFRFRHWMFGFIPADWTVRILEVEHNRYFIDEMIKGALRAFRHEHRVQAAEGGTLYTDRVTYRAIGGAVFERLFVDAYLKRIFDARHRNMQRLLSVA